jgi:hypothetical protein
MTAAALHVVCTTAGAVLSAGSYNLTFAAGELTTGVAVAANSSGLTVKTSVENESAGHASRAILQYRT